jgi:VIT1/CCC1 family predicted Fe2+/Mn2+ transporter
VQRNAEYSDRSRARAKVWSSLISTALGVAASLISTLAATADLLRLPMSIVVAVGAVAVTGAFTIVLARRERGPSRVAKLKRELTSAYLSALDGSVLNPSRTGGR